MTLTLRAVSLNDQPLTQPITAHFDLQGGTIGRADHNTLALPDPERHISREQAEIYAGQAGFVIRNVGSSNPIVVRNQPLAHGESAPLAHNDHVRIGRYLLEVIDEAGAVAADPDATTRARPFVESTSTPRPIPSLSLPGGDALGALSPGNPFADLLGAAGPGGPASLPGAAAPRPASPAPAVRLPEDFDPFAAPASTPASPRPAAVETGAFGDLVPSSAPASIDQLFGLGGGAADDPLAGFLADVKTAAGSGAPAPTSTDPLVLFGAAATPVPPAEITPDRTPELHAAFTPPQPVCVLPRPAATVQRTAAAAPAAAAAALSVATPAPVRTAPEPVRPPAAPASADAEALWAAFCEGTGVQVDAPQGASPELMRLAGGLLRSAVDGTLKLMAVRAATRHELRAQVTVIQARNNNPLKFSPDAQGALEQLLQPPLRGFLPGPVAVTEAMDDLVGHAIGTMAGTRAALEGVLSRFDPQALEEKLAARSVIDSVLPMARKARLWELFLQHYEGIREEAQEDFHALFGKAFLAAYEKQLAQLRSERQRR